MVEKCKRCDKAPSKTPEGYCGRCRRTKEIIALVGPLEGQEEEKTPKVTKTTTKAEKETNKGPDKGSDKCARCEKFPRKVEEFCGRCANNKEVAEILKERGIESKPKVPKEKPVGKEATEKSPKELCLECQKKPQKPDADGYCGVCFRTAKVQARLRGDETTEDSKSKEKVPKVPKEPKEKKSKEVPEGERCARCEKTKAKEGCEGYCGSCYRTKEVKMLLNKLDIGVREQLRYEELDPEAGVVRVMGSNLVLRINPLENSHILVGELEGEKLVEVSPEAATEFLNKYGLSYKFDPTLKFSFALPEPNDVPEF